MFKDNIERVKRHQKNLIYLKTKKIKSKKNLVILVEGENDARFFEKFLVDNIKIIYMKGKTNVIAGLLSVLEDNKFIENKIDEIIGIVDTDFDNILSYKIDEDRLFYTDTHDLETMMLKSLEINDVLREHMKFSNYKKINKEDLLKKVIEISLEIGKYRLDSLYNNKDFKFKEMEYQNFINFEQLLFEKEKFHEYIRNRSSIKANKNTLEKYELQDACKWQVCCGHDITNILAGYISLENNEVTADVLEKTLRLSFHKEKWIGTNLFKKIYEWEALNEKEILI